MVGGLPTAAVHLCCVELGPGPSFAGWPQLRTTRGERAAGASLSEPFGGWCAAELAGGHTLRGAFKRCGACDSLAAADGAGWFVWGGPAPVGHLGRGRPGGYLLRLRSGAVMGTPSLPPALLEVVKA